MNNATNDDLLGILDALGDALNVASEPPVPADDPGSRATTPAPAPLAAESASAQARDGKSAGVSAVRTVPSKGRGPSVASPPPPAARAKSAVLPDNPVVTPGTNGGVTMTDSEAGPAEPSSGEVTAGRSEGAVHRANAARLTAPAKSAEPEPARSAAAPVNPGPRLKVVPRRRPRLIAKLERSDEAPRPTQGVPVAHESTATALAAFGWGETKDNEEGGRA